MEGRAIPTTAALSRFNDGIIVRELRRGVPRTASEIATSVGLSRPNVQKALNDLVGRGIATKSEPVALVSGRPAALWGLRTDAARSVAIDIGAHSIRIRVDDLAGPGPTPGDGAHITRAVGRNSSAEERLTVLDTALTEALGPIATDHIGAVVAATPGIIDAGGRIVRCEVMPRGWRGALLRDHLIGRFPRSAVHIENDANMAALAEHALGNQPLLDRAARDTDPRSRSTDHDQPRHMVVVSAGRRIAFGVILGGELHRGRAGMVGEPAGIQGSAWRAANRWLKERHDDTAQLLSQPTEDQDRLASALGTAFAELVYTIDPAVIVVSGPLSTPSNEPFLARVAAVMDQELAGPVDDGPGPRPAVLLSTLGDLAVNGHAVVLGAAERASISAIDQLLAPIDDPRPSGTPRERAL